MKAPQLTNALARSNTDSNKPVPKDNFKKGGIITMNSAINPYFREIYKDIIGKEPDTSRPDPVDGNTSIFFSVNIEESGFLVSDIVTTLQGNNDRNLGLEDEISAFKSLVDSTPV